MGYLNCRKAGTNYCFSGNTYLFNSGTIKLHVRTKAGSSTSDVLNYPLTKDTTASQYCPINIRYNNSNLYLARTQILSNTVTVSKTMTRGSQTSDALPQSATATRTLLGTTLYSSSISSNTWTFRRYQVYTTELNDIYANKTCVLTRWEWFKPINDTNLVAYNTNETILGSSLTRTQPILNMAHGNSSQYSTLHPVIIYTNQQSTNFKWVSLMSKFINSQGSITAMFKDNYLLQIYENENLIPRKSMIKFGTTTRSTSAKLSQAVITAGTESVIHNATQTTTQPIFIQASYTLSSSQQNSYVYKYSFPEKTFWYCPNSNTGQYTSVFNDGLYYIGQQKESVTIKRSQQYTNQNANV